MTDSLAACVSLAASAFALESELQDECTSEKSEGAGTC